MRRSSPWTTLFLMVACLACLPAWAADPVIGHLQTRHFRVTISEGANGPHYTVQSTDGRQLAEQLRPDELAARWPELHQTIQSALAADTDQGQCILWAGM